MSTSVAGVPDDSDLLMIYQLGKINIQCISDGPNNQVTIIVFFTVNEFLINVLRVFCSKHENRMHCLHLYKVHVQVLVSPLNR